VWKKEHIRKWLSKNRVWLNQNKVIPPWLLTMMWHSHQVWVCNSADIPNAATIHRFPISEANIIGSLPMMVHKWHTTPKLTWSLVIDITNNEKAPGTLPLGDCDCLSRPSHPSDPTHNSLPAPSLGPPPVPFYTHPSQKQSPHVSGTASNSVMSPDQTQTLGIAPDQSDVPKPKTKMQLQHNHRWRALDSNCP